MEQQITTQDNKAAPTRRARQIARWSYNLLEDSAGHRLQSPDCNLYLTVPGERPQGWVAIERGPLTTGRGWEWRVVQSNRGQPGGHWYAVDPEDKGLDLLARAIQDVIDGYGFSASTVLHAELRSTEIPPQVFRTADFT